MHVAHREPEIAREMLEHGDVATGASNTARLAGRHLAEEGLIDGIDPTGDAGDLHHEARTGGSHVARVFAERPFRLADARRHESFDDDLGVRWHLEVVRLA